LYLDYTTYPITHKYLAGTRTDIRCKKTAGNGGRKFMERILWRVIRIMKRFVVAS